MWEWVVVATFALIGIVSALLMPRVCRLLMYAERWAKVRETTRLTVNREEPLEDMEDSCLPRIECVPRPRFSLSGSDVDAIRKLAVQAEMSGLKLAVGQLTRNRDAWADRCREVLLLMMEKDAKLDHLESYTTGLVNGWGDFKEANKVLDAVGPVVMHDQATLLAELEKQIADASGS